MISDHAREAVVEFNKQVNQIAEDLDVDLAKRENIALKVLDDVKVDLKSTDERLQKKIEDVRVKLTMTTLVN